MQGSEPLKQFNYYVDVHIQDQIAALKGMFGQSREDPGARLTQYMLPYQAGLEYLLVRHSNEPIE